jgi:hypothetical protein
MKIVKQELLKHGILLIIISICCTSHTYSQSLLNKTISLDVNRQRMDNVLEIISNKGNFYFSYNSNIIKRDSLISFSASNKSVKQILSQLFPGNFDFIESGNYIILKRKPLTLTLVANQDATEDKMYTITGQVLDEQSGAEVANASVYEKQRLVSALTNNSGYFKLKLKSRYSTANLTVSKAFYKDTTVTIQPKFNQQLTITIVPIENEATIITVAPEDFNLPDTILFEVRKPSGTELYLYKRSDSVTVEKKGMGKFLLSAKQKVQTINLKNFFTTRPYQFSITPGLSTHGKLNSQVVSNISFNLLGGYAGGVNGVELGAVFNLDKKDVQFVQVAGVFNLVGGRMRGVQLAGVSNTVLDSVTGVQAAGVANTTGAKLNGAQLAGVYNHALDSVKGVQASGVANFANKNVEGAQIAGVINVSRRTVAGAQVAGVFNYAKKLKGVQVGLINVVDSSEGVSIGLINIVLNGYHKLAVSTNEVLNLNLAMKTGSNKFYSMLLGGFYLSNNEKVYSFGFGVGRENGLGKLVAINTELSAQHLYLGTWDAVNILSRAQVNLNLRLSKFFSIYAGPAYNIYYSNQTAGVTGYKFDIPGPVKTHSIGDKVTGWIGWNAGIHLF